MKEFIGMMTDIDPAEPTQYQVTEMTLLLLIWFLIIFVVIFK